MKRELPSKAILDELFSYDPETGALTWKPRPLSDFKSTRGWKMWNTKFPGRRAGAVSLVGYRQLAINNVHYYEHRIIWVMLTGSCDLTIDHIDGDRANNAQSNMRSVPHVENMHNQKRSKANTSGVTGVTRYRNGLWAADIGGGASRRRLGHFSNMSDAIAARKAAEIEMGYHPNHGRVV